MSGGIVIGQLMTIPKDPTAFLSRMLASGGDGRIVPQAGGDANQYGATPYPRAIRSFASSTANDISTAAFAHLGTVTARWPQGQALSPAFYEKACDALRHRMRSLLGIDASTNIVFAPSGTDLEFVALQLAQARSALPVTNILLGADEVGSGCVLAAEGRYFATETALAERLRKGDRVAGFDATTIVDIPVRCALSMPRSSADVAIEIDQAVGAAHRAGRHSLVHIVHGSKTGLILPTLGAIDALQARHGDRLTLVVDACQARLEPEAVRDYLARGAIVFITGSKFMGGPPFSGFALIPAQFEAASGKALAPGLVNIFRHAEWPATWAGANALEHSANPGLLLRLEAAIFEWERFAGLDRAARDAVIASFSAAVDRLAGRMGTARLGGPAPDCSLELATLATLDIARLNGTPDLAVAQRWQRVLTARGIRLGQPVKCVRLPDGRWGGTLRISLSMPLIVELAGFDENALTDRIESDMARIADVLIAASSSAAL
jgi:selenocysteine lyase/cysteine desulfurase